METNDNKEGNEAQYKAMTQMLRLANSDQKVGEYLKWIIKSDTAKEYWAAELAEKDKDIERIQASLLEVTNRAIEVNSQLTTAKQQADRLAEILDRRIRKVLNQHNLYGTLAMVEEALAEYNKGK